MTKSKESKSKKTKVVAMTEDPKLSRADVTLSPAANVSAFAGQNIRLVARASLDMRSPFVYRWYKDNTEITGEYSPSSLIPTVTDSDNNTNYKCKIVDSSLPTKTATSATCTIIVDSANVLKDRPEFVAPYVENLKLAQTTLHWERINDINTLLDSIPATPSTGTNLIETLKHKITTQIQANEKVNQFESHGRMVNVWK